MQLIFAATSAGVLSVASAWPTQHKAKTVYFARKNRDVITRDAQVKHVLVYGDLSYSLVDHLAAYVEQVSNCSVLLMLHANHFSKAIDVCVCLYVWKIITFKVQYPLTLLFVLGCLDTVSLRFDSQGHKSNLKVTEETGELVNFRDVRP